MAKSQSATTVSCKNPPAGFSCERCAADKCTYSVHYTEGSAIQGHVVTDYAFFTRSGHDESTSDQTALVFFGCQTMETGMFFKQVSVLPKEVQHPYPPM